jgi:putative endonuclease
MWNQSIGKIGEQLSVNYLKEAGIKIITRNFRTDYGEIDIIGLDNNDLVFFEVKTRSTKTFGEPEIAITPYKLQHMINSAEAYMQVYGQDENWRIDVVAVSLNKSQQSNQIHWIKNVTESY